MYVGRFKFFCKIQDAQHRSSDCGTAVESTPHYQEIVGSNHGISGLISLLLLSFSLNSECVLKHDARRSAALQIFHLKRYLVGCTA